MLKVNNRNTRTRCEICSKLTIWFLRLYYHIIKNGIICILKTGKEMMYNCVSRNALLFIFDGNDTD